MKDMFRKAIRRGLDELDTWVEHRHAEREFDLRLGFWAAEAAMADAIARVFDLPVSGQDWETHLSAHCFAPDDYQPTMEVSCRQGSSRVTDVRLETSVYPEEERGVTWHGFGLIRDPPAAMFDPAIRDLEAVAAEVTHDLPESERGPLRKRFSTAAFEMRLPVSRREAVEAFRGPFERLPSYEGEVGVTSSLRMDDVAVGTGAVALWASVIQESDDTTVSVDLTIHLRSAEDRAEIERRLDEIMSLLKAAERA